jgi:release factor glutamine methyltransferase
MKNVFVPQYDTEGILDFFDESKEKGLEIGVGTGVISISLAKHFNKEMTGIDINKKALRLTAENAGSNGVLLELKNKDLFNFKPNEKFDFLVTNPPYISYEEEVEEWVENNQPKEALYATDDGLAFYKYLLKNKDLFLKPKGRMIFEIGYNQKEKLTKIVEELNVEYNFMKDLSGN